MLKNLRSNSLRSSSNNSLKFFNINVEPLTVSKPHSIFTRISYIKFLASTVSLQKVNSLPTNQMGAKRMVEVGR